MYGIGLDDKVNTVADKIESRQNGPYTYHPELKYAIANVAKHYCRADHPDQAMQALLIAKQDMLDHAEPHHIAQVQKQLDEVLPRTDIQVPKWLRGLPLYPSPKYRRADEIRDMFASQMSQRETHSMLTNADRYATVSNSRLSLETAMQRINAPLLKKPIV